MVEQSKKTDVIDKKAREGRSPAFPFIDLQSALRRAEEFRKREGKHLVPLSSAFPAWKLSATTSSARQTAAALGHFGLFDFSGSGEARQVRLTDVALKILLDTTADSPERDELTRQAALKPAIHKELFDKWGTEIPSDSTFETYLVRDRGFSRSGAQSLMIEYKDTLAFAKFSKSDNIPKVNENVFNSETGILTSQTILEAKGASSPPPAIPLQEVEKEPVLVGEREWLRGPLARDVTYRLIVSGDIGPREIGKLIKLLTAQKEVLSEDDDEERN
ncbi:MAG TPA: hypothetical protein PK231_06310 [Acidocella sp.]|nr:hypothetical protein [Acidocella sp.]